MKVRSTEGLSLKKLDDFVVEAGRVEAGAASDDDVGDALAFGIGERELVEGAARQLRRELLKGLHAAARGGEVAAHEERGLRPAARRSR